MVTWADIRWEIIIGGLGLFLFGIQFMGDGLKSFAGDKLRDIIDKYTSKPIYGIAIGALITVFIQSSSATTAIVISLIRAGLMRLDQAIGVIMGANIGTTVTAFLIGLSIDDYALWIVFVGAIVITFAKRKKFQYVGNIILGFGLLFYGLSIMGSELKVIKDIPEFQNFAVQMGEVPIFALLAGTVMTAVIQSSSATIGIVQKIYASGGMSLSAALPFVFGANIGTTITAVLAAIGGSLASKRAAGIHALFNVIGSLAAFMLLQPFIVYVSWMASRYALSPEMQLAVAHITFNIIATAVFYPFISSLVKLIKVVLPGKESERKEVIIEELDESLIYSLPSSALELSKKNIVRMFECSIECLDNSKSYLMTCNKNSKEEAFQLEDVINNLDGKITNYMTKIGRESLGDHDMEEYNVNMSITKNIERIGDLVTNLVEFYDIVYDAREVFSDNAKEELGEMYDVVEGMLKDALLVYSNNYFELKDGILEQENHLDELEMKARRLHFDRIRKKECVSGVASSVYVDILGTIERIGDHASNITKTSIDYNDINHLPAGTH